MTMHGMTYITKIILSGITIINNEYFDNTNDKLLLKIKLKRHCQDNTGVYHIVSRTKKNNKITTLYNMLIIYSSKKDTLESVETKNFY